MNQNNTKISLYGMGGWSQFFFLFFLFTSGLILGMFILFLGFDMDSLYKSANTIRMSQAVTTTCMFLLPSIAFAYICYQKPKQFLKLAPEKDWHILLLAVLIIVCIQPFANCLSYYNQQMVFPESLQSLEEWMRRQEDASQRVFKLLFAERSVMDIVFNLLLVSVLAGVAEEFFFRGCLQQIMRKITGSGHAAVWITAIIFSIIHFQFYGFIPRVILGALLGYLFLWSSRLWVPVIVHMLHNAIVAIISYVYHDVPEAQQIEFFSLERNWILILFSILSTGLLLYFFKKRNHRLNPAD